MSELESRSVDPSIAGLDANGRYCRSYIAVHDLLTHLEDMSPVDVVHYTLVGQ
ncbi:hypothetical protein DPMN_006771 [Dreissena polymorpha]|uniref:Uncharacterized protein n=1 Tax=Dreissena polymorpha TaxID=45954 RepID=A0A9D4RVA3_DREPO|nr:hypothetical protein DPMN_006771 [Dreissena polymorpha]